MYNFGLSDDNLKKLYELYPKIIIKKLDYSLYPDFVNPQLFHGLYCSYAFKTIAIYLECQCQNSNLIWMDSANRASINSLNNINNSIIEQGFYCPISSKAKTIEALELHHKTCLKTMNVNENEYQNLYQCSGNLVGVNYKSDVGKFIINSWYKYSLDKNAICPDGSSRNNHRQDQSVLSIIMYLFEQKNAIKFTETNFNVQYWIKKDKTTISEIYKPFKLLSKQNNQQLAIIYCENVGNAIKIYAERKNLNVRDFMTSFLVKFAQT